MEQAVEPGAANWPAAQVPVTAVSPVVAQYDPEVQSGQLPAPEPALAAKVPAAQNEQDAASAAPWSENFPATQSVQADAPAAENLPAAHGSVTAERPVVPQNEPASQVVQPSAAPDEGAYEPVGHEVQAAAVEAEKDPEAHKEQAVAPEAAYSPAEQPWPRRVARPVVPQA
jgi:hypothetical protein